MTETQGTMYGFIGAGNMGSAMLKALVQSGLARPCEIMVTNRENRERIRALVGSLGVRDAGCIDRIVEECDIIILAVKPNQVPEVVRRIGYAKKNEHRHTSRVLVSVVAGVTIDYLRSATGGAFSIVRAMPNTPAQVGEGVTALSLGSELTEPKRRDVERLFTSMGEFHWVDESKIDAVTALSGSGPAYFFNFAAEMTAAAVKLGLDPDLAEELARQTLVGAGRLLKESDMSLGDLVRQVTSPNGTTAAALGVFSGMRLDLIVKEAMDRAVARSKELARSPLD